MFASAALDEYLEEEYQHNLASDEANFARAELEAEMAAERYYEHQRTVRDFNSDYGYGY